MAVVEPRLPEPMTPGRAQRLADRWRRAAVVVSSVGALLSVAGVPYVVPAVLAVVAVCLLKRREYVGWRDGYRAAWTEALRRGAGERLCPPSTGSR